MKYRFRMAIGDWSEDGHCRCDYFTVASNYPVEDVREAHYKIKLATGVDIEAVCSEYEEDTIDYDVLQRLKNLGFKFEDSFSMEGLGVTSKEMAEIWLFLLQETDPTLELKIIDDEIPTLHFYGFDKQGRHIGQVGYGLFE